jgi:O-acetyl-ADP-ribose deacetylase (regulator of RNase III)
VPIKFVTGDMFKIPAKVRVNTVNCVGVMGSGVALACKRRYPAMYKEYREKCKKGEIKPGSLFIWEDKRTHEYIVNFPTKRHWRNPSQYDDIESGLVALKEFLHILGKIEVALPALGCGHGGLDWVIVAGMIYDYLNGLDANIHVFKPSDSRQIANR